MPYNKQILQTDNILTVTEMNEAAAIDISCWTYPEGYKMYNFDGYEKERDQLFNGLHFPVYFTDSDAADKFNDCLSQTANDVPCGFIAIGPAAQVYCRGSEAFYADESFTDIGLGLRPELCGLNAGLGDALVRAAINFVKAEFPDDGVRLTVAENNARAKKVYERNGFTASGEFKKYINVSGRRRLNRFIIMIKDQLK